MNESGHAGGNVRPVVAELLFRSVKILFPSSIRPVGRRPQKLTDGL
jgi:hypothetical protein